MSLSPGGFYERGGEVLQFLYIVNGAACFLPAGKQNVADVVRIPAEEAEGLEPCAGGRTRRLIVQDGTPVPDVVPVLERFGLIGDYYLARAAEALLLKRPDEAIRILGAWSASGRGLTVVEGGAR